MYYKPLSKNMVMNKSPPQAPLGSGFSKDPPPSKVQKIQKGGDL